MERGVKFAMNREEMKSLSAKQMLIAREKLEHGFTSPISFQIALEIVRNIGDKLKLRELELQTLKT